VFSLSSLCRAILCSEHDFIKSVGKIIMKHKEQTIKLLNREPGLNFERVNNNIVVFRMISNFFARVVLILENKVATMLNSPFPPFSVRISIQEAISGKPFRLSVQSETITSSPKAKIKGRIMSGYHRNCPFESAGGPYDSWSFSGNTYNNSNYSTRPGVSYSPFEESRGRSRGSPPPGCRTPSPPPFRFSYSPPPRPQPQPQPSTSQSSGSSSRPRDSSPVAYTYDDEEPDSIPHPPAPWNNFRSESTREQLVAFFVSRGYSKATAEKEVGKEFEAHAPQHRSGMGAGPSRQQERLGGRGWRIWWREARKKFESRL